MSTAIRIPATLALMSLFMGCASMNNTMKGGLIGAGAGGLVGGIIGKVSGNTAAGVIIGSVVGGAAGAAIGNYMDRQAADLQKDLKNAKVERVGEGIKITFASGILFDVNSANLRSEASDNIGQLAKVLQKYEDTKILVQGHSDSTGSDSHNMTLSEKRASSVGNQITAKGVKNERVTQEGHGESMPVADNGTTDGRQQNRRVEVAIWANEKLKQAAKDGKKI